jgi:SagB-type dehydrogenase family enzyme
MAPAEPEWPVGFRIRPPADPGRSDAEVADIVSGRRFRWSANALAERILRGEVNGDGHAAWGEAVAAARDRSGLVPGWRHWEDRGWYPSGQYYVASRRWAYRDSPDPDGAIREATIRHYLEVDGPPEAAEPRTGRRVKLEEAAYPDDTPVSRLLVDRRSGRAYARKPVPLARLSGLLWHGLAEVRAYRERACEGKPLSLLDSYGSAWDFYVCAYNIAGLEPGIYRYGVSEHDLTCIRPGDHRAAMVNVMQGMRSPATAAWTLGLVADFPRYQWRYRHEHGLRRLYMESGILAQELLILAMAYGLSTLVTPAQRDRPYMELHELSPDRFAPIYTLTMGWSRGSAGQLFEDQEPPPPAEARREGQ